MPVLHITKQAIDCDRLREERHELLTAVADENAHVRHRRYLARLISNRLREIEEEMKALGCPSNPDVAEVAEIINELDGLDGTAEAREDYHSKALEVVLDCGHEIDKARLV